LPVVPTEPVVNLPVAPARHLREQERSPRRRRRLSVPVAAVTLVTGAVVAVSVSQGSGAARDEPRAALVQAPATPLEVSVAPAPPKASPQVLADRARPVSRSARRVTIQRLPKVVDVKYRTADLNLWRAAQAKGRPLAVLPEGGKVAVTGVRRAGLAQIVRSGQVRWVNAEYLAEKKPVPPAPDAPQGAAAATGLSSAPCADGSGTESGLTSSAVRLFRGVCNAFPALSSYGGFDGHGEHSSGRAIDFMTSDSSLGQAVADWARAHASELDLYDVIWAQHIWTPVRSAEGWRSMSDRGSSTANHYDHVHISVN
jgi:hypothetical protein